MPQPLAINKVGSVRGCLDAISKLVAQHNITGIGVVLVRDNDHLSTHQWGMTDEDMIITAELFVEFAAMEED